MLYRLSSICALQISLSSICALQVSLSSICALQVSLIQNCQPPRRVGRAAQMKTIFIALLFFPSFVGSLSLLAYTSWRYWRRS